ncbi:hypothetical protein Y032_0093g2642 [Ancylostoma ceylanicum]|nr:hypothetical protein Y032_0093g2642 [Ancylostoma ceylanicum]
MLLRQKRYAALNASNSQQIAMVIPSTRKGHNNNNTLQPNHHSDEPSHHHAYSFDHKSENGCPRAELVSGAGDTVLKLNIGGMSFRIRMTSLFSRTDEEKLVTFAQMDHEKRIRSCDAFIVDAEEYYFERSSILFDAVFKYYATGQLHRPLDVCPQEFANELSYWKIPESVMSTCCWRGYNQLRRPSKTPSTKSASIEELTHKKDKNLEMRDRSLRSRIHQFCEGDGSLLSTLFTFGSISFVLISVIGLILGSIHEFQVPIVKHGRVSTRVNNLSAAQGNLYYSRVRQSCTHSSVDDPPKLQFLVGIMNIVDLVAIIPFYLELGLTMFGIDVASLSDIKGALLVVRVLRVLRVVRILKLGRYSSGMRTFALTLRSSARQLGMMGMVLSTGVVFFSTLLYFVEKDEEDTPFTSIPAAFWWAIVTMTTVGYGDYVPVTIPGKLIASGAIISGVLVLALPITIIVDNFMKVSGK